MADPGSAASRLATRDRLERFAPWAVALVVAGLVLGPALGPGALFNLDLILTPDVPVPAGVWGLGPELPRRLPFMLPVAWISSFASGEYAGRALMAAAIVLALVGAYRLTTGAPTLARAGAALLYGAGPFLVTRVAVGHLNVALAAAALPWALPTLLRPGRSLSRTFLAASALAFAGVTGGLFAGVLVVAGLVADRERRWVRVLVVTAAAQLVWAVAGVVTLGSGADPSASPAFAARLDGVFGLPRLVVGQGFWEHGLESGAGSLLVGAAGVGVAVLAAFGARETERRFGRRFTVVAALAFALPLASALIGVRGLVVDLTSTPVGALVRDTHRTLPVALLWFAVSAAHGTTALGRRSAQWGPAIAAIPLALALLCVGPGLGGIGGQLDAVALPAEWGQIRSTIQDEPGTVLALPWSQYFNLTEASGRRVHQPLPAFLGGDVIIASDPKLGGRASERADPREPSVDALMDQAREGELVGQELADLGIRWVVILHSSDWRDYGGVLDDPDLVTEIEGPTIELRRVDAWPGPVVADDGSDATLQPLVGPLATVDLNGAGVWARPGGRGWLRGWSALHTTPDGLAAIPAGGRVLWYWPSVLVLIGYVLWVVAMVCALARSRSNPGFVTRACRSAKQLRP